MIKKIAILLSLILCAAGAKAQLATGSWTLHTPFSGVTTLAETSDMVFIQSGSSLLSVDKATSEVRTLNISNDLNGSLVSGIYPNPSGEYIIVAYSDGNMDRINNNGSVISLSDISDANIIGSPSIKDIGFGKDRFYVVTSFGLVTYNDRKNEVVETLYTDQPLTCVTGLGDKVVLFYNDRPYVAKASDHLVSLDKFKLFKDIYVAPRGGVYPLGENRVLLPSRSGTNSTYVLTFDWENGKVTWPVATDASGNAITNSSLMPMGPGKCAVVNDSHIAIYDDECAYNAPERLAAPAALKGSVKTALKGLGQVWAGFSDGVCSFDLTDASHPVQTSDKLGKQPFSAINLAFSLRQPDGSIFFWNARQSLLSSYILTTPVSRFNLSHYSKGEGFADITPDINVSDQQQWVVQDPIDPSVIYVSVDNQGIYRFKNGKTDWLLNKSNSSLYDNWGYRIAYLGFDNFNNLIAIQETPGSDVDQLKVIPYSKLNDAADAGAAMKSVTVTNVYRTTRALTLRKSNTIVVARGAWTNQLSFVHQGASGDPAGYKVVLVDKFIDQDNIQLDFQHIQWLHEDRDGRLWVAVNNGLFEITDPSKVTSSTATVRRLKVPRNDGTNLADYLCNAQSVSCIDSDNSNRKWISTYDSGVYLVSEDGTRIIENFTSMNSPLPSNKINSVACDRNSSSVFFTSLEGVSEYSSTSAPASDNLDEVYAYPNPVRPDYTGWITITGLMDNTLVKIADAAGNVFFQGRSEGGLITWDGCNAAGDRVKTGVYYVFASSGTSDQSGDSCVTKIMVIN
jgi:putative immunoreactive antigen PG93